GGGGSTPRRPRTASRGYGYYAGNYDPMEQFDRLAEGSGLDTLQQAVQQAQQAQAEQAKAQAAQAKPPQPPTVGSSNMPGVSSGPMTVAVPPTAGAPQPGALNAGGVWPLPNVAGETPGKNDKGGTPDAEENQPAANAPVTATNAPRMAARDAGSPTDISVAAPHSEPSATPPAAAPATPPSAPASPDAPSRGFFGGIAAAVAAMQTADWVRLAVVLGVLGVIAGFAAAAWRFAYSPAPQRKNGHGKNPANGTPAR
ncbi:MAG TPA: hypothetical protein PKL84_00605, partial [Candidatus Hydrogenedentes bacterium]|nr:hypothetical protein [Candidatus Hydrogenedentota bacterium]